jgi:hypothetical protein
MFPLVIIGIFGISALVMLLWNWIIPTISPLTTVTYWQAMGLLVLSRILFGRFRFGRHHKAAHRHFEKHAPFKDKLMNMNDEERQQFKNQWKQRCCKPPTA